MFEIIKQIPRGRVATYGQIAKILGVCGPRTVGYALNTVKDESIPWHRVVNSKGKSSLGLEGAEIQLALLKQEGVAISEKGIIDLTRHQWEGPTYAWVQEHRDAGDSSKKH
ncbi:MAG TPA: MGMT family protein [Thermotogota bacterium]|nr:MGMT family protein [Thermotogota bacterium]MDD8052884.1 MGMT family protein [Thermotogota bacterium]HNT95597.1 MGMT family protein [Thermotogota bacterium]HPX98083.1 MGMT family protein [Thermotogota bacterium]